MSGNRLQNLYSSIVHDVLRAMGVDNQVLPKDIGPLSEGLEAAGTIFTVEGRADDSISEHDSLLAWTEMLSIAPRESVIVLAANDDSYAHMGELSAETLLGRGIRGFVTDGGARDVKAVRHLGFPVWCRYATPSDIVGRWTVTSTGRDISIGDVEVASGDLVIADDDGVVVIPAEVSDEVIDESRRLISKENAVRNAIRDGMSPKDAYLEHRKF